MKVNGEHTVPALTTVFEDDDFIAVPCRDCDVPGYLVLIPKAPGATIADLPMSSQHSFGSVLALLEGAVQQATGAEHVYILRFSEGLSSVHFHIFPRTRTLASQWVKEHREAAQSGINGPLLFGWARLSRYVPDPGMLSSETHAMAGKVRDALAKDGKQQQNQTSPERLYPS